MYQITSSLVQEWVTLAAAEGLSARSIRKYPTMLHSIFKRAVRDQLLATNPCVQTELPKGHHQEEQDPHRPTSFSILMAAVPGRYRLMVETAIETGMRWGELIALNPRHVDFLRRTIMVEDTIIEVSKRHSPTGERYVAKPYPKNYEPHVRRSPGQWLDAVATHQDPRHRTRPTRTTNHENDKGPNPHPWVRALQMS